MVAHDFNPSTQEADVNLLISPFNVLCTGTHAHKRAQTVFTQPVAVVVLHLFHCMLFSFPSILLCFCHAVCVVTF